jgi:hypothetical protein
LDVWERALADVPQLAESDVIADVPQSVPQPIESVAQAGKWRIEVTHAGQRWHWRKGRGKDRQHRPGGRFEQLSQERQAEYEQNKIKRLTLISSRSVDHAA